MSFSDIFDRLSKSVDKSAAKDIAAMLEMTPTALSERKKRNSFPEDKLHELAKRRPDLDLNVNYILTGTRKVGEKRLVLSQVGGRIQEERIACGYELSSFAQYMNVSDEVQQNIENNDLFPEPAYLIALAQLRFDVTYILTGIIAERPKNPLAGSIAQDFLTNVKTARNEDELYQLIAYRTADKKGKLALKAIADVVINHNEDI
ncbi:hypothetical protein A1D23_08185 [Chelonobacter oris]|uniref:helix-turn-helix domain-containing protein n=1 Tax=Chelonobacter oris TaxID=505317 RepID=UPI0024479D73|nr:hypothetical protein [Chelonobacter oris]MDH3000166.1 hypothetical protein [Chelonobacter oris]